MYSFIFHKIDVFDYDRKLKKKNSMDLFQVKNKYQQFISSHKM